MHDYEAVVIDWLRELANERGYNFCWTDRDYQPKSGNFLELQHIVLQPSDAFGDGEWGCVVSADGLWIYWNQYGRSELGGRPVNFWGDTSKRVQVGLDDPQLFELLEETLVPEVWRDLRC